MCNVYCVIRMSYKRQIVLAVLYVIYVLHVLSVLHVLYKLCVVYGL